MAVLVIYFLEAVQVDGNQSQRLAVAARSIEFFFECFTEETAAVETSQRIGHGIEFQPLELVILDEDGNTQKAGSGEDVRKGGPERDWTTDKIDELAPAGKHLSPNSHTCSSAQVAGS